MVDTCDPAIAGWSEDGETFIVKDPVKFEKQIIPQFFKHSKFTSFVRVRFVVDLVSFRPRWRLERPFHDWLKWQVNFDSLLLLFFSHYSN